MLGAAATERPDGADAPPGAPLSGRGGGCSGRGGEGRRLPDRHQTRLFILLWLFSVLSLPLNCSLTRGLINSYAGQLKHIGCDPFCSTDKEEVEKAAPNGGKRRVPTGLLVSAQMDLNPRRVRHVQAELGQLRGGGGPIFGGELLGSSSLLPWAWQGKLSLVTLIEVSSVGLEDEKPHPLCRVYRFC